MMRTCTTQAEVDAALAAGEDLEIRGEEPVTIVVTAGTPLIEAWESSQPRVEARESSRPLVEAWGYVQLALVGAVTATCAPTCQVSIEGDAQVTGGHQVRVRRSHDGASWCDWYGVAVVDGVATLYKAVGGSYRSPRGWEYTPGTVPEAPDWDGGEAECGGGLHFSPSPSAALEFWSGESEPRFVACPVRVEDIVVHRDAAYPQKVKARACCAPVYEVDIEGRPVAEGACASGGPIRGVPGRRPALRRQNRRSGDRCSTTERATGERSPCSRA